MSSSDHPQMNENQEDVASPSIEQPVQRSGCAIVASVGVSAARHISFHKNIEYYNLLDVAMFGGRFVGESDPEGTS